MDELVYVGCTTAISKKNGKPFYMAHFYGKDRFTSNETTGYRAYPYFIDESLYLKCKGFAPLSKVTADIRYINKSDVLLDINLVK